MKDRAPIPNGTETILIVEDERAVRDLVALTLEARGYHVLTAETPEDAVQLACELEIDLLLSDLVMPGLSGRELAARIRADRPELRILFMSGYADEAVNRNGTLEPGAAFLEKPFTAAALATKIRDTLDRPPTEPGTSAGLLVAQTRG